MVVSIQNKCFKTAQKIPYPGHVQIMPKNTHFKAINQIIGYGIGFLLTCIKSSIYSFKMGILIIAWTGILRPGRQGRQVSSGFIRAGRFHQVSSGGAYQQWLISGGSRLVDMGAGGMIIWKNLKAIENFPENLKGGSVFRQNLKEVENFRQKLKVKSIFPENLKAT